MAAPARFAPLLAGLALGALGLLPARPAAAEDPAPAPARVASREVWVLETTVEGRTERKELDVTDMPPALRQETLETLRAIGWRKVETKVAAKERPPAPPAEPVEPVPPTAPVAPRAKPPARAPDAAGIEREIDEIRRELNRVRKESELLERALREERARAGARPTDDDPREPEIEVFRAEPWRLLEEGRMRGPGDLGSVRHVVSTFGRLMLRYLEDKKDPAKAAVWEEFFRTAAEAFVAAGEGKDDDALEGAMPKVTAFLVQAMQDPAKAEVLGGILRVLTESMRPGAGGTPPHAAPHEGAEGRRRVRLALPERSVRIAFAGASLVQGPGREGFTVEGVEPGSVAAQIGLEQGDTIVEVGGEPASTTALLRASRVVQGTHGGELSLAFVRQGKRIELDIEMYAAGEAHDAPPDDDR